MPEGPEIRRAADTLSRAVVGQALQRIWFAKPELKPYEDILEGAEVRSIAPRGKALLTVFEGGLTLYTHNQLYGIWKVVRSGARPRSKRSLRVAIDTAKASILLYSASDVEIWPSSEIDQHPLISRLGPDVLDPDLQPEEVATRLRSRRFAGRTLAALLLDQHFLAGIGNYLRSEILFHAGIAAERRGGDLSDQEAGTLAQACIAIPQRSYCSRGISPAAGMRADYLNDSDAAFRFHVFDRAGEPCLECTQIIERVELAGRRLYRCPQCQS